MAQELRVRTRLTRATRREQIIDAAVDVFKGRDPNDVTFEEVADAAGVSRALVYNYFGDRRGLDLPACGAVLLQDGAGGRVGRRRTR